MQQVCEIIKFRISLRTFLRVYQINFLAENETVTSKLAINNDIYNTCHNSELRLSS